MATLDESSNLTHVFIHKFTIELSRDTCTFGCHIKPAHIKIYRLYSLQGVVVH